MYVMSSRVILPNEGTPMQILVLNSPKVAPNSLILRGRGMCGIMELEEKTMSKFLEYIKPSGSDYKTYEQKLPIYFFPLQTPMCR